MSPENEALVAKLKLDSPTYLIYLEMPDGSLCVINRFMFTYAILSGITDWGYEDRWCYDSLDKAMAALVEWKANFSDMTEPTGWHRHPRTGRRVDEHGIVTINF